MNFFAEMLTETIGWPVCIGVFLWLLLSKPKPTKRHTREVIEEAGPAPEPKVPCDTSRPYPRPKGHRSKLNRVCPVCGTGRETGQLDGRLLGWAAHRTCAEWAGDWHPRRPAPPPFRPDPELIGYIEQGQKPAGPYRNKYPKASTAEMVMRGMISVNEARILSAYSIPEPAIFTLKGAVTWSAAGDRQPVVGCFACGSLSRDCPHGLYRPLSEMSLGNLRPRACLEQRFKPPGVPPPGVPLLYCDCPCGHKFIGTEEWLNTALRNHWATGGCSAVRP